MGKWNFSLFHLLVQVYRDLYPQVLLNGEIILSLTKTSPTDVCIRLIRTELQISLIFFYGENGFAMSWRRFLPKKPEIEFLENTEFHPQWHKVLCVTKLVPLFCVLPLGKSLATYWYLIGKSFPYPGLMANIFVLVPSPCSFVFAKFCDYNKLPEFDHLGSSVVLVSTVMLTVTEVLTTCAVVIFRVKVSCILSFLGSLVIDDLIDQLSCCYGLSVSWAMM